MYVRYRGILIGIPSFLAVLAITSAIIMKVVFSRRRDRHEQRRRRLREQVEQRPPRGSADLHEGNGVVPEDRREVVHNAIQRAGEAQGGEVEYSNRLFTSIDMKACLGLNAITVFRI